MGKPKRNRDRKPARGKPYRDPKPISLIITEGENTEPEYLSGFKKVYKNSRVDIEFGGEGVTAPMSLVQRAKEKKKAAEKQAKREKDDNLKYDEVWCVFDVDEHLKIPDAKQMARDNDIKFVISNPCFEIWLWLHFAEQPGIQDRHKLQKKMKKHISKYDKHVNYADYQDGYEKAVKRAQRLSEDAFSDKEEEVNPSTSVWILTENIRENA
ncbi:MAG: RloB domain-containing protein [Planctomycetaceae bacterium]|nr:RloB domain-containing protein [Planctomycetaceae bacterium]